MKHYRFERGYLFLEDDTKVIILLEFETIRETPNGYWIKINRFKEKFVLKDSRKRYAYPTKQEAFESFRIRTIKSWHYASRDVNNAKVFIDLINNHELNTNTIKL